jgi:hypothetical protein
MPDYSQSLPSQITMCRRQLGLTALDPSKSAGGLHALRPSDRFRCRRLG